MLCGAVCCVLCWVVLCCAGQSRRERETQRPRRGSRQPASPPAGDAVLRCAVLPAGYAVQACRTALAPSHWRTLPQNHPPGPPVHALLQHLLGGPFTGPSQRSLHLSTRLCSTTPSPSHFAPDHETNETRRDGNQPGPIMRTSHISCAAQATPLVFVASHSHVPSDRRRGS
ncbi:hypothetical protein BD289DRAFT_295538 [Coniella lustricola]|uniref:Secreted protein n=1 Tax=Coniella lustricola TaxID=2025994 RepID=A0A2T3A4R4_9PEZI|nr:hypothetical protein BD289DRAFT_295538 [Coniella lustricola]